MFFRNRLLHDRRSIRSPSRSCCSWHAWRGTSWLTQKSPLVLPAGPCNPVALCPRQLPADLPVIIRSTRPGVCNSVRHAWVLAFRHDRPVRGFSDSQIRQPFLFETGNPAQKAPPYPECMMTAVLDVTIIRSTLVAGTGGPREACVLVPACPRAATRAPQNVFFGLPVAWSAWSSRPFRTSTLWLCRA